MIVCMSFGFSGNPTNVVVVVVVGVFDGAPRVGGWGGWGSLFAVAGRCGDFV